MLIPDFIKHKIECDEPIPLNFLSLINGGIDRLYDNISIIPVASKYYYDFYSCCDVLIIEKERIPDPSIIKMDYLNFICNLLINESNEEESKRIYTYKFFKIFQMCLNIEPSNILISVDEFGKFYIKIKDVCIYNEEFEFIRYIICEQNLIEMPNINVNPEVKKALDEALEFKNRNSKKMGSYEDQVVCIMITTSLKENDIYNISLRKFQKILQRVDYKLHYEIYKTAESGGMVTFKKPIDHWMTEITVDKYEGLITEAQDTINSFSGNNEKEGD